VILDRAGREVQPVGDFNGRVPLRDELGDLWQHSQASASLVGPGLDGPYLLEAMNRHARRGFAPASRQ
jgi:hypothetical protein